MNIGCDIVENRRLENRNQKFIELILTKEEQKEYKVRGLSYLCGRFAAKEAIMKALPNTKKYNFLDFEILTKSDGNPYCNNMKNIKISISHEKEYTIAFALVIKKWNIIFVQLYINENSTDDLP